jgi:hypothetical protein
MKFIIMVSLFLFFGCAHKPIEQSEFSVREYILDVENNMLRAKSVEQDQFLKLCETQICYVLFDEDLKAVKKYIIDLESMVNEAN